MCRESEELSIQLAQGHRADRAVRCGSSTVLAVRAHSIILSFSTLHPVMILITFSIFRHRRLMTSDLYSLSFSHRHSASFLQSIYSFSSLFSFSFALFYLSFRSLSFHSLPYPTLPCPTLPLLSFPFLSLSSDWTT